MAAFKCTLAILEVLVIFFILVNLYKPVFFWKSLIFGFSQFQDPSFISKDDKYHFELRDYTKNGTIWIPGGGYIDISHNTSHLNENVKTHTLLGMQLQPQLIIPHKENVIYRKWPLDLTNLDYSFLLSPSSPCLRETNVVALVLTTIGESSTRQSIRNTWASVSKNGFWPGANRTYAGIKVYFLLGSNKGRVIQQDLRDEQNQHKDIILCEFVDSYSNLTLKVLMGLKWMVRFCPHVKFMLKVDTDVFINVPALMKLVESNMDLNYTMIGMGLPRAKVMRRGKFAVAQEHFPLDHYPPYLSGPVYMMTNDLYSTIVDTAVHMPPINIEDSFVTGIVALACKAKHLYHDCFKMRPKTFKEAYCACEARLDIEKTLIWQNLLKKS